MTSQEHNAKGKTMGSLIEKLCKEEQLFWDNVAAESVLPGEERILVIPATSAQKKCRMNGVVAVTIGEQTGNPYDVEYVKRMVNGKWELVPTHQLD